MLILKLIVYPIIFLFFQIIFLYLIKKNQIDLTFSYISYLYHSKINFKNYNISNKFHIICLVVNFLPEIIFDLLEIINQHKRILSKTKVFPRHA